MSGSAKRNPEFESVAERHAYSERRADCHPIASTDRHTHSDSIRSPDLHTDHGGDGNSIGGTHINTVPGSDRDSKSGPFFDANRGAHLDALGSADDYPNVTGNHDADRGAD